MGRIEWCSAGRPTGTRSRDGCRAYSASPTSPGPAARRSMSTRSRARDPRRTSATGRSRASFRLSARRADKRFPLTSPEIEREVGGRIKEARGWTVNLEASRADDPRRDADGRGVLLLRQGARRRRPADRRERARRLPAVGRHRFAGRRVAHDAPRLPRARSSTFTAIRSCRARRRRRRASWRRLLTRYQYRSRLLLVPFGEMQQQVVLAVPPPLRVVIYRRLMMRIAERSRGVHRARALVTGEVVGQVASQTLENLRPSTSVVDDAGPAAADRDGQGRDHAEAQRLGTYPISIIPDQDCCTLFTPKHPATKARRREVERAEAALPIDEMVEQARRGRRHRRVHVSRIKMTRLSEVRNRRIREAHTRQARRHEGGLGRPRRDRGRRDGSARIAAEGAGEGEGRRRSATARWRSSRSLVTEVLTPHASAILLDPEWGIPASKRRAKNAGLLLAYEKTGYDATTPGRLPDLLDVWSVRRLKESGADCIKILLYYTPFDPKDDQRPEARVGRAHRRRVPRQRHPVLPRVHRLRGRRRRKGPGVREEEAADRRRAAWRSSPRTATASTS